MTQTNPNLASLAALILAAVVLPPLVAATLLRGGPEAPAQHAAFCSEAAPTPAAPASPPAPAVTEPVLACGPTTVAVAR
jgi:hypothetical protein